jgi:hypothetical protein
MMCLKVWGIKERSLRNKKERKKERKEVTAKPTFG